MTITEYYASPLVDEDAHRDVSRRHTVASRSVEFQTVPFAAKEGYWVEGIFGKEDGVFDGKMIVFFGLVDRRHIPKGFLPHGTNWVSGSVRADDIPRGIVCLSKTTFLESCILRNLEAINKETTIVPSFSGVNDGELVTEFATWGSTSRSRSARAILLFKNRRLRASSTIGTTAMSGLTDMKETSPVYTKLNVRMSVLDYNPPPPLLF